MLLLLGTIIVLSTLLFYLFIQSSKHVVFVNKHLCSGKYLAYIIYKMHTLNLFNLLQGQINGQINNLVKNMFKKFKLGETQWENLEP